MTASILIANRVVDFIVLVGVLGLMYISLYLAKMGKLPKIRAIPAFEAIEEGIGRAVEKGSFVHYTTGSHQFFGQSSGGSAEMMASLGLFAYIAELSVQKGAKFISSVPYPEILAIESATLRSIYTNAGLEYSEDQSLRYMPIVSSNAPYAAGVAGFFERERPATNFMLGPFFFEALVIPEAGNKVGAFQVAGTSSVGYTAFFIGCCDYVTIGEELYALQALATKDPIQTGSLRGNDLNKIWIIALIIIGVVLTMAGMGPAFKKILMP